MKYLLFIIKKIIFSFFLLYGFNLIFVNFNIVIPFNFVTILFVTLLGAPAIFALLLFKILFM